MQQWKQESATKVPPIVCADDVQQQVKQVKLGEAGADQPEIKSYPTSHQLMALEGGLVRTQQ